MTERRWRESPWRDFFRSVTDFPCKKLDKDLWDNLGFSLESSECREEDFSGLFGLLGAI